MMLLNRGTVHGGEEKNQLENEPLFYSAVLGRLSFSGYVVDLQILHRFDRKWHIFCQAKTLEVSENRLLGRFRARQQL